MKNHFYKILTFLNFSLLIFSFTIFSSCEFQNVDAIIENYNAQIPTRDESGNLTKDFINNDSPWLLSLDVYAVTKGKLKEIVASDGYYSYEWKFGIAKTDSFGNVLRDEKYSVEFEKIILEKKSINNTIFIRTTQLNLENRDEYIISLRAKSTQGQIYNDYAVVKILQK